MDAARTWAPRGAALIAFAVYALTAPGSFFWLDSGELSASGLSLGVAHPTGFPLYMVLVKAASFVPLGELAFRVNLLSAVCASLAVLWVSRLVFRLCASSTGELAAVVGAVAAGLALAFSHTFFRQATVAEVYAPNAALLAGALLLIHSVATGGGARAGLGLAVTCGLGLSIHSTFVFVGPPVAVLLLVRLYRGARWVLVTPMLLLLVVGGTYLYLPVRAVALPPVSAQWARADHVGELLDHVTGRSIREAFTDEMRSTATPVWTHNARVFFGEVANQLVFTILAAAFGLLWLLRWRMTRWLGATLLVLAAGDGVYSFWMNPMGQVDLQNGVPFALAACAAAGAGVAVFAGMFGRAAPFGGAVAAMLLVVPSFLVSMAGGVRAAAAGDLPRRWSELALAQVPARGVALVDSDSLAAGMIFLSVVEGARPDVTVLVRQRLTQPWRLARALGEGGGEGGGEGEGGGGGLDVLGERPVLWEMGSDAPPGGARLELGVPLSRVVAVDSPTRDTGVVERARAVVQFFDNPSGADPSARLTEAHTLNVLGRVALGDGDHEAAKRIYAAAIAADPTYFRALINGGAAAAARGDVDEAIRLTDRGLAVAPSHALGRINLTRYLVARDRDADALGQLDALDALRPAKPKIRASALALRGLLAARAGDVARASALVEQALAIDARNGDARRLARQLRSVRP